MVLGRACYHYQTSFRIALGVECAFAYFQRRFLDLVKVCLTTRVLDVIFRHEPGKSNSVSLLEQSTLPVALV
jgi:hypothetical protein